ncbi:MAG: ABC transporter permease [Phycisphaerales bacterium]
MSTPVLAIAVNPPSALSNIFTIARRELREAVRSRWFLLYTLAFALLGLGVSYLSAAAAGGTGLAGFGRTTAGLVNLVLLVIPLMALTAGAGTIAGDRERGMLAYLAAQPVSRIEILLGKYLGLAGALLACLCLGYGACAAVLALKGEPVRVVGLAVLVGLSMGLALSMLSLGVLVSVLARKASVAVGTAVFIWLTLVFVTDLGLMAGALAMRLRIEQLLTFSMLNPLQVFKMWSLHAVDANLDVLGPAGLYAQEEFGAKLHLLFGGCLAAWTLLPLTAAAAVFSRKAPV